MANNFSIVAWDRGHNRGTGHIGGGIGSAPDHRGSMLNRDYQAGALGADLGDELNTSLDL